ncbi:hypothetical protein LTR53_003005 [Teratosphaeriaceae sp. CCFEE 6253]|nr:hypothetical protein LTR53_003005 [Teratosphaeriaceae sp. CCFEE 6253]
MLERAVSHLPSPCRPPSTTPTLLPFLYRTPTIQQAPHRRSLLHTKRKINRHGYDPITKILTDSTLPAHVQQFNDTIARKHGALGRAREQDPLVAGRLRRSTFGVREPLGQRTRAGSASGGDAAGTAVAANAREAAPEQGTRGRAARRVAAATGGGSDDVPFEGAGEAAISGREAADSTITPREKKVFEKLLGMPREVSAVGTAKPALMADEGMMTGLMKADGNKGGLDGILETAVTSIQSRATQLRSQARSPAARPAPTFPLALRPLVEEAAAAATASSNRTLPSSSSSSVDSTSADPTPDKLATQLATQLADLTRLTDLLSAQPTDVDCWMALKEEVLSRVAALELDDPATGSAFSSEFLSLGGAGSSSTALTTPTSPATAAPPTALATQAAPPTAPKRNRPSHAAYRKLVRLRRHFAHAGLTDREVLTANLPAVLTHYLRLCARDFPASPLALNLLPALREMGPAAFALGVTTPLYNAHLALLHKCYPHEIGLVNEVLAEMDGHVYAFDEGTLGFVEGVLRRGSGVRYGHQGAGGGRELFRMGGVGKWMQGLGGWRGVMLRRREEAAMREVRGGLEYGVASGEREGEGQGDGEEGEQELRAAVG